MNSLLKIDNLKVSFYDEIIIDNISFEIKQNEIISLVGKSGTGKSTILKAIFNLIDYSGHIKIDNSAKLSFVPQNLSLLQSKTVEENINIPKLLGNDTVSDDELTNLYKVFQIDNIRHKYPHAISGGQESRVALLRSFSLKSNLLCLDESFSKLDEITKDEILAWLKNILKSYQKSMIYVTHNLKEAIDLSDRIMVISNNGLKIMEFIPSGDHVTDYHELKKNLDL